MSTLPSTAGFFTATIDDKVQQCLFLVFALVAVSVLRTTWVKYSQNSLPIVNPSKSFDFTGMSTKVDFLQRGYDLVNDASRDSNLPYSINSDVGPVILLPSKFAEELKNNPRLGLTEGSARDFHAHIPGFATFRSDTSLLLASVAKKQLTKYLNKVTEPLSDETAFSLKAIVGESPEWKTISIQSSIIPLVSRLSSRVFLGDELCRDPVWLECAAEHPVLAFTAAYHLRLYPQFLRPIVHWFLQDCKDLRRSDAKARAVMQSVIDKRAEERRKAQEAGLPIPKHDDAIEWAREEAGKTTCDAVTFQLALADAAVHTTSDLTSQTLVQILSHPEILQPLRSEMVEVLKTYGWTKTALYHMKLTDSVLKETQRLKPLLAISMQRMALGHIRLSNGLDIPKGSRIAVGNTSRLDESLYENPERFDGYRFHDMRNDPEKAHMAQFVTTGTHALGFGHGQHSCPGRFFAANEIKVLLCHLLLKYDLELQPDGLYDFERAGFALNVNKDAKIRVRRRKAELDIDNLTAGALA
ncbi:cytochrome P450 [Astrocystis sublimbata]|nr:cytochrome P450 [Astrocystis sublimbata]